MRITSWLSITILATVSLLPGLVRAADFSVILSGLGGEESYTKSFADDITSLKDTQSQLDDKQTHLMVLQANATTLDAIDKLFKQLGSQMHKGDQLQLYLVGHGSFDGSQYKFNIKGPDITGKHLQALLDGLPQGPQLVVAMTSSSGALQDLLDNKQRVVITATRNGMERNAPVFDQYWVAGLSDDAADTDKNELLSAAELYNYTIDQVAKHFEKNNLLASEHARISNQNAAGDFVVARVGQLAGGKLSQAAESLLAQRKAVEKRVEDLKAKRASMTQDEYFDQLQPLILELGRLQREIDQEVGDGNAP